MKMKYYLIGLLMVSYLSFSFTFISKTLASA